MSALMVEIPMVPTPERELELIEEARRLADRINRDTLKLGRLALEYAPVGPVNMQTGASDRIRRFADEVGVAFGTVRIARMVAWAWVDTDVKPGEFPFNMLQRLAPVGDKEQVLEFLRLPGDPWTVDQVVAHAREQGWMPAKGGSRSPRPGSSLRKSLAVLEDVSLRGCTPSEIDRYAPLVDGLMAEVQRLNQEVRGV